MIALYYFNYYHIHNYYGKRSPFINMSMPIVLLGITSHNRSLHNDEQPITTWRNRYTRVYRLLNNIK